MRGEFMQHWFIFRPQWSQAERRPIAQLIDGLEMLRIRRDDEARCT
jgi:hypothetical protein